MHSVKELHELIASALGIPSPYYVFDQFRCVEVREIESCDSARQAARQYPEALYALLVCDEGWRHADRKAASSAVARTWGTRSFVSVASIGDGCLVLNLRPPEYRVAHRQFFNAYYDSEPTYYFYDFRVAGLEHGPFLAMELCSFRKCIVDDLANQLKQRSSSKRAQRPTIVGGIRNRIRRQSLYRSLLQGMQRLQMNPPTELGALDNLIESRSGLPERLQYLHQVLQAFEAEEQVNYAYRVNRIMASMTVLGVVVAVIGVIIAVLVAK